MTKREDWWKGKERKEIYGRLSWVKGGDGEIDESSHDQQYKWVGTVGFRKFEDFLDFILLISRSIINY